MRVFDIVFSPTGGTERASGYIANALEGETVAVDLTDSGLGFRTVAMTKEDVAVIAVPSYGGRVPAVAAERLGMMRGNGAQAVLVCVYGNRAYEDTLVELEDAAKGGLSGDRGGFCHRRAFYCSPVCSRSARPTGRGAARWVCESDSAKDICRRCF